VLFVFAGTCSYGICTLLCDAASASYKALSHAACCGPMEETEHILIEYRVFCGVIRDRSYQGDFVTLPSPAKPCCFVD